MLKIFFSLLFSINMALETCVNSKQNLLKQEPEKLQLYSGETTNITCTVTTVKATNMYLRKRFTKIMTINTVTTEIQKDYQNRMTCSGEPSNFTVTLANLTEADSDFYICDGLTADNNGIHGNGTLIIVGKQAINDEKNENETGEVHKPLNKTPIIISVCVFLIILVIFAFVVYKTKMEKKKGNQSTYVDMTQTLRRNTMQSTNVYCQA
ncbi:uncharacterized protein [Pyxicephalus adspersus]|uniref:uncharacterized protein n=1 Tax=Pyxicephalus adspersus TaxID=30357 RepID=UPI003B5A90C8